MGEQVKVADLQTIERLRADVIRAAEAFDLALSEAQAEIDRASMWVGDQRPEELRRQIRKTQDDVVACRTALFNKQEIKATPEARPSVIDERKALERAQRRLAGLEHRLQMTKRWTVALPGQVAVYRAGTGPLRSAIDKDIPRISAMMRRMIEHLEAYRSSDDERSRLLDMLAPRPEQAQDGTVSVARGGDAAGDPAPDPEAGPEGPR